MSGTAIRYDGILLLDKPVGITSAKAVSVVKGLVSGGAGRRKSATKVGHLGTLDPFASGLLPLCLGEGTKIAPYLNTADKSYTGTIKLGVTTDTLDSTGDVVSEAPVPTIDEALLSEVTAEFTGALQQVPPAFSAIKKDGVRMYELARRGEAPELAPRAVTIHRLRIERAGESELAIEVDCSKGTYIRSLARDIGERLGCGGNLATLRRTGFGGFRIADAIELARLESGSSGSEDAAMAAQALISPARALDSLPTFTVGAEVAEKLRNGQQAALAALGTLRSPASAGHRTRPKSGQAACAGTDELAKVVTAEGGLAAIVAAEEGRWRIARVFRD